MLIEFRFASVLEQYTQWDQIEWDSLWQNTLDTLYMTFFSMIVVLILGVFLGLLLYESNRLKHPFAKSIYRITSLIVNVLRSIPFLNLIIFLIPITLLLLSTMTGPIAALPALILSTAPFYARLVETGFRDIDRGVIEAAEAMGANKWQVIYKVLIPESLPSLVAGITVTAISLIGFSAVAGIIGAGGLGNMAYLWGFQRRRHTVTLAATVVIVILVFIIQAVGDYAVAKIDKR